MADRLQRRVTSSIRMEDLYHVSLQNRFSVQRLLTDVGSGTVPSSKV